VWVWIASRYDFIKNGSLPRLEFQCIEHIDIWGNHQMKGSSTVRAILDHIRLQVHRREKNVVTGLVSMREFRDVLNEYDTDEFPDEYTNNSRMKKNQSEKILYISDQQNRPFILQCWCPNIDFTFTSSKIDNNNNNNNNGNNSTSGRSRQLVHNIRIRSLSTDLIGIRCLQEKVQQIVRDYDERQYAKIHNSRYVFKIWGNKTSRLEDNNDSEISYTRFPFVTTCRMDTVYFPEKDNIMRHVNFFVNNRDWYVKHGKPYTLTLCTHGPPGCGKTSFEKALAYTLDRHICVLDLKQISTPKMLDDIFFKETIGDIRIPFNKRLYVIPDVDAQNSCLNRSNKTNSQTHVNNSIAEEELRANNLLLQTILQNKEINRNNNQTGNNNTGRIILQSNGAYGPHAAPTASSAISLSNILNVLDGVPERSGQIIIFSTNHPERLDPALTRPGRIDHMIRFTYMQTEDMARMVRQFFPDVDVHALETAATAIITNENTENTETTETTETSAPSPAPALAPTSAAAIVETTQQTKEITPAQLSRFCEISDNWEEVVEHVQNSPVLACSER